MNDEEHQKTVDAIKWLQVRSLKSTYANDQQLGGKVRELVNNYEKTNNK